MWWLVFAGARRGVARRTAHAPRASSAPSAASQASPCTGGGWRTSARCASWWRTCGTSLRAHVHGVGMCASAWKGVRFVGRPRGPTADRPHSIDPCWALTSTQSAIDPASNDFTDARSTADRPSASSRSSVRSAVRIGARLQTSQDQPISTQLRPRHLGLPQVMVVARQDGCDSLWRAVLGAATNSQPRPPPSAQVCRRGGRWALAGVGRL